MSDAYVLRAADDVALWAIEYVRSPAPGRGKLRVTLHALPWDEGAVIRAAVVIYESRPLAMMCVWQEGSIRPSASSWIALPRHP